MVDYGPVIQRPSPNHGDRRGYQPSLIVLHYTAMDTAQAAVARLCDPQFEVSAHYLICNLGTLTQMVDEDRRAWHAGAGCWGDIRDVNSHSIGIELANPATHPFPNVQMKRLEYLLDALQSTWDIPAERVIGHSDLAPGRKSDPGVRFDWARLARSDRGVIADKTPVLPDEATYLACAKLHGYTADVALGVLLDAVRLHHRPAALGCTLDAIDMGQITSLARNYPFS